jgi:hypothetical protein
MSRSLVYASTCSAFLRSDTRTVMADKASRMDTVILTLISIIIVILKQELVEFIMVIAIAAPLTLTLILHVMTHHRMTTTIT